MRRLRRFARRFGLGRAISLVLLAAFLLLRYWDPRVVEELRMRSFDLYQDIKPRAATARPVVIVDIDEASLKAYGQWPWPRTLVADLVDKLTQMGSAAIGFDVLFAEPDRTSPGVAAALYRGLDDATREKLAALPSNDEVLAAAIKRSKVVLGQSGDGIERPDGRQLGLTGFAVMGPDPKPYLLSFPVLLGNIPVLEQAAAGRGLFSFRPDRDGIVRRAPLAMIAAGQLVPALSTELIRLGFGASSPLVRTNAGGVSSIGVPRYELPTDGKGQVWVYYSRHDRARYVSAKDILDGTVDRDRFRQRIALVGTSAIGLLDLKTTPVDGAMPGVEVHAQVIESALAKALTPDSTEPAFLSYSLFAPLTEMLAAFVLGAVIIFFGPLIGPLAMLIVGAAGAAGMVAVSWYMFAGFGLLYDVTFPLMCSLAVYAALVFVNYFREQAGRQRVRSAFGQYLSPTLVEQLAQSPDKLVLGGEERTMTIMFSDVRGFTALSETFKDDPQGLTQLMNRLLTPLSNAILEKNGTIDKYMGDAIMAFWNAPLDDRDHEANACEAALEMLARLKLLNQEREQEAKDRDQKFLPIKIGVGLNTGRCVVGNMGSDMRFQYTVLGDSVNLASRIEGQTKSYGVAILIGANTAKALREKYVLLELDCITVKGKTEPETIYTVLGPAGGERAAAYTAVQEGVGQVLKHYRAQEWTRALDQLETCKALDIDFDIDVFAELYFERIEAFRESPPGPDWNGVFALTTK
jgi:adenylate cyclase